MPHEILFSNVDEAEKKVREIGAQIQECRLKVGKEEVKLKLRTKRTLYTLVLKRENTGAGSIEDLKKVATELATRLGCPSVKEI